MKKPPTLVLLAAPFVGLALPLVAGSCGFPSVTYESADGASASSSSGSSSGADHVDSGSSGGDAGPVSDVGLGVDSTSDGSASTDSASIDGPSSDGDGAVNCDMDNDGYKAEGACGGDDCCDSDPSAHPGVTAFFTMVNKCGTFDYACNPMGVTMEWGTLSCTGAVCGTVTAGFVSGTPACGSTAPWANKCSGSLNNCAAASPMSVQQACR